LRRRRLAFHHHLRFAGRDREFLGLAALTQLSAPRAATRGAADKRNELPPFM